MSTTEHKWLHGLAAAAACLCMLGTSTSSAALSTASGRARVTNARAKGIAFEPNRGQSDDQVRFIARGGDYTVFLTATEAVFSPGGRPGTRGNRSADRPDEARGREPFAHGDDRERVAGQGELRSGHGPGGAADRTSRPTARCAIRRCIPASTWSSTTTTASSSTTSSLRRASIRRSSRLDFDGHQVDPHRRRGRHARAAHVRPGRSATPRRSSTRSATAIARRSRGSGCSRDRRRSASG